VSTGVIAQKCVWREEGRFAVSWKMFVKGIVKKLRIMEFSLAKSSRNKKKSYSISRVAKG